MLSKELLQEEQEYLKKASRELAKQIKVLGNDINFKETEMKEFRKLLWESKGSIDEVEMKTSLMSSELDASLMLQKMERYKKLVRAEESPYFGRIDFKEDDKQNIKNVYIGISSLSKGLDYIIYDWRTPIAGMFYDYGIGRATYEAPQGSVSGEISLRRQYKTKEDKLIRVFDNNLNVVDECLQEVLSEQGTDKMKNIVNTIQTEQNEIIRNISDKNLIVQGIAGSGKTSVALHRIAFLLYKINNLTSSNVLIFSPNSIFTEYISDVLPELGEDNVVATTFHEFAKSYISEFNSVETFANLIEKYYTMKEEKTDLIKFKLSSEMIGIIESYIKEIEKSVRITRGIEVKYNDVDKEYLNYLLKEKYDRLPLFSRLDKMAEHLCDTYKISYGKGKRSIIKSIKDNMNIKIDFKKLYQDLFKSDCFTNKYKGEATFKVTKQLNYEDALNFIYLKGLLTGFPYSNLIQQIVIDEAQDYNELQYIILRKIFKKASFTILGDVNQTINPYQKYDSLKELSRIIDEDDCRYVELTKTYRSSAEIINYTNKILNLKHVSAIRKPNEVPVGFRYDDNDLIKDVNVLKSKYKSLAIITKSETESAKLYNLLKDDFKDISLMKDGKFEFNKDLVIVPSYLAKGLEFDSVISYTNKNNEYTKEERYLFYVVCTRCQHELIIYNPPKSLC